ncbi:hypothetical protein HDA41_008080 [Streptomyces caelestis]|uniref:Uncharacterized protein n=1 Tax=Streptomyces caelestis TaxID=36816 RepID=A0A7W9HDT2_9ACTN|nr:hypothetical protein [Streptomyces caelestis]
MGGLSGFTGVSRYFSLSFSDSQTVRGTSVSAPQVWVNFRVRDQGWHAFAGEMRDR